MLQDPESAWADWQSEYTAVRAGAGAAADTPCCAWLPHVLSRARCTLARMQNGGPPAARARPQVVSGFDQLAGADCMVEAFPALGLAVLSAPEPLHYYSLFSHTIGADVVVRWWGLGAGACLRGGRCRLRGAVFAVGCWDLRVTRMRGRVLSPNANRRPRATANRQPPQLTMYDDNRYEVECKYTQTVALTSRPVTARLDMAPLAAALNAMEEPGLEEGLSWAANRFTDSGPLLRLERRGQSLTKAQRYGARARLPRPALLPPPAARRTSAIGSLTPLTFP